MYTTFNEVKYYKYYIIGGWRKFLNYIYRKNLILKSYLSGTTFMGYTLYSSNGKIYETKFVI